MSHYHHLTLRDRVFISALTISGKSLSEIACAIGKNVSTISRELKRNKAVSAQDGASAAYDPCAAQARYQRQRKHCGKRNILKSDSLLTRIVSNLLVKKFWSPEQIQYRLRKELPNLRISATTIYRGINSGFLDRFVDGRKMSRHLRHHGKTRHRKGMTERRGRSRSLTALKSDPWKLRTDLAWGIGKAIPSSEKGRSLPHDSGR